MENTRQPKPPQDKPPRRRAFTQSGPPAPAPGQPAPAPSPADPPHLIYEDTPLYDLWLKLVLVSVVLLTLVAGVIVYSRGETGNAIVLFGVTVFDAALFYFVMPRKYQIYSDRLRVVMGGPFAFNARLNTVKEAKPTKGTKVFGYSGLRFATSSKTVIEIVRPKAFSLVISPSDRDTFLRQLQRALPLEREMGDPNAFDWKKFLKEAREEGKKKKR